MQNLKIIISLLFLVLFIIPSNAQTSSDRYASWNNVVSKPHAKSYIAHKKRVVKRKVIRNYNPNIVRRHTPERHISLAEGMAREIKAAVIVGGRPEGCPRRFCGCALSIKLFGRIIPHLNLAANWLKFPATAPAPGMVAARRGHVFKLLAHVGGNTWRVWDANSGRGKIRIHNRSIAGFRVVRPVPS